jgi:hypothetical protein
MMLYIRPWRRQRLFQWHMLLRDLGPSTMFLHIIMVVFADMTERVYDSWWLGDHGLTWSMEPKFLVEKGKEGRHRPRAKPWALGCSAITAETWEEPHIVYTMSASVLWLVGRLSLLAIYLKFLRNKLILPEVWKRGHNCQNLEFIICKMVRWEMARATTYESAIGVCLEHKQQEVQHLSPEVTRESW